MPSPVERWRLLPFELLAADEQFARSEAMLAHARTPALRWYQITPEALVLGRSQPASVVDWDGCSADGLRVYRRATGGGAVLAGPDILSLDVVLPSGHPLALHDVRQSYEWLGKAIAEGLRSVSMAAETVAPEQARAQVASTAADDPARLACYAMLSPHELLSNGRKVVGLAQARRHQGALLQAGLLWWWRPERLLRLLDLSPEQRGQTALALQHRCAGIAELRADLELDRLIQLLTRAISETVGVDLQTTEWTASERATSAEALARFPSLGAPAPDSATRDRGSA